jgi:hypothetical protein
MKLVSMIAACAALSISGVAFAAETATAPAADATAPAAVKPAKDPNRVICKTEQVSGSLIATQKTCLTSAQWKDKAFRASQWTDRQTTMNSPINGGK